MVRGGGRESHLSLSSSIHLLPWTVLRDQQVELIQEIPGAAPWTPALPSPTATPTPRAVLRQPGSPRQPQDTRHSGTKPVTQPPSPLGHLQALQLGGRIQLQPPNILTLSLSPKPGYWSRTSSEGNGQGGNLKYLWPRRRQSPLSVSRLFILIVSIPKFQFSSNHCVCRTL